MTYLISVLIPIGNPALVSNKNDKKFKQRTEIKTRFKPSKYRETKNNKTKKRWHMNNLNF